MKWVEDLGGDFVNLDLMFSMYVKQPNQNKAQFYVCVFDGEQEYQLRKFSSLGAAKVWQKKFMRSSMEINNQEEEGQDRIV